MSNYVEYNDTIAFHPGYYLKEIVDVLTAKFQSQSELERERNIFTGLDYRYFREHFGLPDLPRKIDEQIEEVSMRRNLRHR